MMGDVPVLPGLMMDVPLTVGYVLGRMRAVHGSSRVVTLLDPSGQTTSASFPEVVDRAERLAAALARLGVHEGDRVGSYAWNTQQHLEIYYGVMGLGAVLHTINLRLHLDQVAYTIDHAQERVVIVDVSLAADLATILPRLPTVEHVVVIGGCPPGVDLPGALSYEQLVEAESPGFRWPDLDERAAASLCYTSGTTGDPKGVLYSHRSIVLHALAMSGAEVYGLTRKDRVLSLVPLFHAMGWGLPFVCGLVGADLVLPGRFLQAPAIARLVEDRRVTWSCGVPTLWMDLLQYATAKAASGTPVDLSSLRTVLCGGTHVPQNLMEQYERRFGVDLIQGWGMTEIFPGGTISQNQAELAEPERWSARRSAGVLSPLYEMRVVNDAGGVLPTDGTTPGEVEVRGPVVASAYYRSPVNTAEKFHDGWLRTGDIGTLDAAGRLRITDRSKDAIKSGGEWISSVDLESALMAHPAIREAAVIGRPDPRWSERPLAYLVVDRPVAPEELDEFLAPRVARWWIPEDFRIIEAIPRTSTGKFDKKQLRELLAREQAVAGH